MIWNLANSSSALIDESTKLTSHFVKSDGYKDVVTDLDAMGALDPVRAAKYGVSNWSDLTEAQLEAEIPYFDSVMSVNVEDGTASELTVENRGKNLIPQGDWIQGSYGAGGIGYMFYKTRITTLELIDLLPQFTYTISINPNYQFWPIILDNSGNVIVGATVYYSSYTTSLTNKRYLRIAIRKKGVAYGSTDPNNFIYPEDFPLVKLQLEIGTSATDYVAPREDSITIPDTVELHGYNGVFNTIDNHGRYVKYVERDTTTTDASGYFTLTNYKQSSKVIVRNITDGRTLTLDAQDSLSTGWNNTDIEYLYVLDIPVETIVSLTGDLKLYQGQNNVLSLDSSLPIPIQITHVDNEVETVTNMVGIENIVKTGAYEWNTGIANWTLTGKTLVNLIYSGKDVPDGEGRYFKACLGNTYIDILNETKIDGDNTYYLITNTSGDTADLAVYDLTSMGKLTQAEADKANALSGGSYDTDTYWEDLTVDILVDMLYFVDNYTKEYTSSITNTRNSAVLSHVNINTPALSLKDYRNIINSNGTATKYVWLSDYSEGTYTHLGELDNDDYIQVDIDADLEQEIEDFEIGVVWDYSSDVSTLSRDIRDITVETFWDYSSDTSTLRRILV